MMTNTPLAKQARNGSSEPSMGVKNYVDGLLQAHKVVVFSKSYCPYCHKARAALETQNLKPGALEWVEIDGRPDCGEIQDYLQSLTGARSVPRVFINQKFFGGGDDTAAAAKNGKLASLLKEAQAI
ncbi:Glutaredoxin [Ostertagia ostertagi]